MHIHLDDSVSAPVSSTKDSGDTDPTLAHIAARVRMLRNAAQMTQQDLAKASGVDARSIRRVEGSQRVSRDTLRAICAALNTDAESLFREIPPLTDLQTLKMQVYMAARMQARFDRANPAYFETKASEAFWTFAPFLILFCYVTSAVLVNGMILNNFSPFLPDFFWVVLVFPASLLQMILGIYVGFYTFNANQDERYLLSKNWRNVYEPTALLAITPLVVGMYALCVAVVPLKQHLWHAVSLFLIMESTTGIAIWKSYIHRIQIRKSLAQIVTTTSEQFLAKIDDFRGQMRVGAAWNREEIQGEIRSLIGTQFSEISTVQNMLRPLQALEDDLLAQMSPPQRLTEYLDVAKMCCDIQSSKIQAEGFTLLRILERRLADFVGLEGPIPSITIPP